MYIIGIQVISRTEMHIYSANIFLQSQIVIFFRGKISVFDGKSNLGYVKTQEKTTYHWNSYISGTEWHLYFTNTFIQDQVRGEKREFRTFSGLVFLMQKPTLAM